MKLKKTNCLILVAIVMVACFGIKRYAVPYISQKIWEYESEKIRHERYSHLNDFPAENNGWKKYRKTPVYGGGENVMFDPYCYVENDTINMLVSDRKNSSLIKTKSVDGIHWSDSETLIVGIPNTWEDIVNRGCLLKHKEQYYLWYTGQFKGKSSIGLAISNDGTSFSRMDIPNPIINPEFSFEDESVMNPCVLYDDSSDCFKMWYSAGETYEPNVINYAESKDGINWVKSNHPVLEKGAAEWEKDRIGGCQVIKTDTGYEMYYIGYQNIDLARICYAESEDGINWVRPKNNLLLSPTTNSWDSEAVYKPTVIVWKGQKLMFYNGRKGCGEYIGLATKRD